MAEGAVAGVDWAKDAHEVLVADREGERLWGETVPHDEAGIARLCRTLVTLGVQRVAVERPGGLLIERLLDAGLTVLAIHPNMVAAARDRFRAAGGKSDRFDAFVLCELARTDSHRSRALTADSDQTKALRARAASSASPTDQRHRRAAARVARRTRQPARRATVSDQHWRPADRKALAWRIAKHATHPAQRCPYMAVKTITPHVLRHTAAMRPLHAGVDSTVIALWLGQEQVETTQMYLHADLAIKERALAARSHWTANPARPAQTHSLDSSTGYDWTAADHDLEDRNCGPSSIETTARGRSAHSRSLGYPCSMCWTASTRSPRTFS